MQVMVQNYSRQLESKEDVIRTLKFRLDDNQDSRVELLTRRESDAIKQENRMLRDKVAELSRDLDLATQDRLPPSALDALESENRRLRQDILEKEREYARQCDQLRHMLSDKDS